MSIAGFAIGLVLIAAGATALLFMERTVALVRRMELRTRSPEELRWTARVLGLLLIVAGVIVVATAAIH